MKIVVIGGSGLIGKKLIPLLRGRGHEAVSASPSSGVKDRQDMLVTPADPHPIVQGIKPFHILDESYNHMRISPKIRPLLTTDNPNSDRYLAWIGPCTTSRVVAIQLGHGHTAHGHPSYRALVHNAILWSAGRIK